MLAALHTWGQTLVLHPHLHCLVTGGGWDGAQWRAVRTGYLLPARVVMPLFRGKLLAALHTRPGRGAADAAGGGDAGAAADAAPSAGPDEMARADHDALCARPRGGDVPGALPARRAAQAQTDRGLG